MHQGFILETSTSKAAIALVNQNHLIQHYFIPGGSQLSSKVFSVIQKFDPKKLSFIAIGIGPGSYTGIRVSVTIGKTLSYALKIPLITFNSLQVFSPQIKKGAYLSMLDAKSEGVYLLECYKDEKQFSFETPKLLSVDQAYAYTTSYPIICSDEVLSLQKKFPDIKARWNAENPNMELLANICWEKWVNKTFTDESKLEPLYLRGT